MELEIENITAIKKLLQLRISEQQDKLNACYFELNKNEKKVRDINRIIKNIRTDIHFVSEHYQNPPKLRDAVKVSQHGKLVDIIK